MPAHTGSTILDCRKRKRRPEGHKIDELYEFSNDSTVIKCFERSTVERIEENSNDLSRCLFIRYKHNTKIYGHRKMGNKKLINRKKTTIHKDGSSALLNIALEMEGKKKRKKFYYTKGYSYLVTHPSTISAEQDLTC